MMLHFHADLKTYLPRAKSVYRLRKKWYLRSTRQQKHTVETITDHVAELRKMFPTQGNENIRKELRVRFDVRASRSVHFLVVDKLLRCY